MKNEMTAIEKRVELEKILMAACSGEFHFCLSMSRQKDFQRFKEKGFKFAARAHRGGRLNAFRGNIFISSILTTLGARSLACDYLLETIFNDFYESLKNNDERAAFSFMVYSALDIFN